MFEHVVGNNLILLAQASHGLAELDGNPMHDGVDDEIEPTSSESLAAISPVGPNVRFWSTRSTHLGGFRVRLSQNGKINPL